MGLVELFLALGFIFNTNAGLIDSDSFLTRAVALNEAQRGIELAKESNMRDSIASFQRSFELFPTSIVASYTGKSIEILYTQISSGDIALDSGIMIPNGQTLSQGYLLAAQDWYQKAYNLDNTNSFLMRALGSNYLFNKDFAKALHFYQKSLEVDPNHAMTWLEIGSLLQTQGNIEGSFESYERCIALTSDTSQIEYSCLLNLATLHHYFGDLTIANDIYLRLSNQIESAAKLISSNDWLPIAMMCPDFRSARLNMGVASFQLGHLAHVRKRRAVFIINGI